MDLDNDPGPVPDVAAAMLRRDFATVRSWLEHPYIGDGGAMNAVAIYLLEHFERVRRERDDATYDEHDRHEAGQRVLNEVAYDIHRNLYTNTKSGNRSAMFNVVRRVAVKLGLEVPGRP
jgi:hypothetical protein